MPFLPILPAAAGTRAALHARAVAEATLDAQDDAAIRPLPAGMRVHLLAILALGYAPDAAQNRLGNAADGAVAWQVQSCLDDYADADARAAFAVAA